MDDLISKNQSLVEWKEDFKGFVECLDIPRDDYKGIMAYIDEVPSAEPERLTDDDFETIRIHLNAYKENLCNQRRWEEAEEYQRIIDRFMAFASAEPERKTGKWKRAYLDREAMGERPSIFYCSVCNQCIAYPVNYCPSCGADMRGGSDG